MSHSSALMTHMAGHSAAAALVSWSRAWRSGTAQLNDVARRVQAASGIELGDEHEHVVTDLADRPGAVRLADALKAFSDVPATKIRLALPAPGDPGEIVGPSEFSTAALDIGQAVIFGEQGLVPTVVIGRLISWRAYPAATAPTPPERPLGEVDFELGQALRETATLLSQWEGAELSPSDAVLLAKARATPAPSLAPGYSQRAQHILDRATLTLKLVALAMAPPPGAASAEELNQWWAALRDINRVARHAYLAAVNTQLR